MKRIKETELVKRIKEIELVKSKFRKIKSK
jgi:hypothetical protein